MNTHNWTTRNTTTASAAVFSMPLASSEQPTRNNATYALAFADRPVREGYMPPFYHNTFVGNTFLGAEVMTNITFSMRIPTNPSTQNISRLAAITASTFPSSFMPTCNLITT